MNKFMAEHQDQEELVGLGNFSTYSDIFSRLTEYHIIETFSFEVVNLVLSYKLDLAIGIFTNPNLKEGAQDNF